jgi:hypothetical protein
MIPHKFDMKLFDIEQDIRDLEEEIGNANRITLRLLDIADKLAALQNQPESELT